MNKLRGTSSGVVFCQLERLFGQGTAIGLTEGELLERFVSRRDEAAFEALVARHGPMVLGVCRHHLRDPNDVDDAFQATFLVLVKKASTVRRCELLGNWLYGVAYRVASRARALAARRTARVLSGDGSVENLTAAACRDDEGRDPTLALEYSPRLHQEVSHLPDKYRTPIVLCYFEGLTHDEAAARLGWPLGTVKGRLARARELLRRRLSRRGVTLSSAALASQFAVSECNAAVPRALQLTTLTAARALAGHAGLSIAATSVISIPVSTLVEGVLHAMFATQIKTLAIPLLLAAGTVAAGITVGATQSGGDAGSQAAPAISRATSEAQGRLPGSPPAQPTATDPNARAVSAELAQEVKHAANSFDRLLDALREPSAESIDRLEKWSALTLGAQQQLSDSGADRLAAAQAHVDRVKKLHLRIANLAGTDQNNRFLELSSIKLYEAERLLTAEKLAKMKGSDPRAVENPSAAGTKLPPDSPVALPAPLPTAATSPPVRKGLTGGSGTMKAYRGMMGGGMGMAGRTKMGGAMGTAGGAMMGGGSISPEVADRQMRPMIAGLAADLAARDTDSKNKAVLKKLDEPISMSFAQATPLEDVLTYIKQATTSSTYSGIPIYVDPKGLKEAAATAASPVSLNLDGVTLKTTLRLLLKQIGLAYCVRDGVLIISSVEGINEELSEAQRELEAMTPGAGGFGGGGLGAMGGGLR